MNFKLFACSECGHPFEVWQTRKPLFKCAQCDKLFQSNYKKTMRQSFQLGLLLWLLGTLLVYFLSNSWALALALSIEVCGLVAALLAVLYFKHRLRIREG